jgi:hypothetical protein
MNNLVVLTYGLSFFEPYGGWITIEATNFDDNHLPISWAIRKPGGSCFSKIVGGFDYEPLPSSRTDKFLAEHRFNSPEEAMECWYKFYK